MAPKKPLEKQPLKKTGFDPRFDRPDNSKEYVVKHGETWITIARDYGMDPWDLIHLNFPMVDLDPKISHQERCMQVNWCLRVYVGCTTPSWDGLNYMFDNNNRRLWQGQEKPAFIWVPLRQVAVARPHTCHYRPPAAPVRQPADKTPLAHFEKVRDLMRKYNNGKMPANLEECEKMVGRMWDAADRRELLAALKDLGGDLRTFFKVAKEVLTNNPGTAALKLFAKYFWETVKNWGEVGSHIQQISLRSIYDEAFIAAMAKMTDPQAALPPDKDKTFSSYWQLRTKPHPRRGPSVMDLGQLPAMEQLLASDRLLYNDVMDIVRTTACYHAAMEVADLWEVLGEDGYETWRSQLPPGEVSRCNIHFRNEYLHGTAHKVVKPGPLRPPG